MKISDKERIDFLQKNLAQMYANEGVWLCYVPKKSGSKGKTARQAIDAEINRQKKVRK